MPRLRGVSVEKEILNSLRSGAKSMRQLQRELGREWNAIWYNLKGKPDNLIRRGCVIPEKTTGELKHTAQDEYVYRLNEEKYEECLRG